MTAILSTSFLHHAEVIRITGQSYRLRNQSQNPGEKETRPPTGDGSSVPDGKSNAAIALPGCRAGFKYRHCARRLQVGETVAVPTPAADPHMRPITRSRTRKLGPGMQEKRPITRRND